MQSNFANTKFVNELKNQKTFPTTLKHTYMKQYILTILLVLSAISANGQRQVEELNRGLIVVYPNAGSAYIGWRLLAKDDWTMGFNVYRSVNGAAAVKLNAAPITNSTNYTDAKVDPKQSNAYFVRSVVGGVELETSETFAPEVNATYRQFFPIPLQSTGSAVYDVLHVYVGDVDGDGDFDYIVKRVPRDAKYNYILLECYDNTGAFKWKINLGPNVDTYISSMTAPVLVADFNGDGKAEIIAKTGEGTVFGNGSTIGDTNGDNKTDYNSHAGSGTYANVMSGPEFISLINGASGAEINRNNFLARGVSTDWGDDYGARMNFIMSSVCSFDGVKPGVVFSRGPGDKMAVDAWEVTNNKLVQKWKWSARGKTFSPGSWEDFHQIQCIDVNADGKDEISWGACMMNPNGTVRYTTGLVHGDRFQITDIDPRRAGLEAFAIQQNNKTLVGSALYDASTGKIIKEWKSSQLQDVGRGDVGDIDPNSPGMEMFDLVANDTHASDGSTLYTGARPYPDVSIWWDADLQREFFRGIGGQGTNPAIEKWDYVKKTQGRLFTIYNDFGNYSVVSPYGGRAPFIGDILGDWREEIILEATDHSAIRVYTTLNETQHRIYTLMQDPSYRNAVSSKGYLCSKYTDYFLGAGMATPPKPNIAIIGTSNNAPNTAISSPATGAKYTASASITLTAVAADRDGTVAKVDFYNGTTFIGSDASAPYSFTWANVAAGTYTITAKATDNNGAATSSSAITVTVNNLVNQKPVVEITAPFNNASYAAPAAIKFTATATDTDGAIAKVEFYNGTILLGAGTANGTTYTFAHPNMTAGTYSVTAVATDNLGASVTSAAVTINIAASQSIALAQGWNLISTNVRPADSTIATLFNGLDVIEIKDMNSYWRKDQPSYLNILQTITSGNGYLVNMNAAGTLTVTGTPFNIQNSPFIISTGWSLIGCPYQSATHIAGIFASNFSAVKDFEGFWLPNGTSNSIQDIEPGKGYYIKK